MQVPMRAPRARDDERCERRVRRGACEARAIRRARRFARDDEVSTFCANFAPTSAANDADDADAAEFAERASTSAPGPPARPEGHPCDPSLWISWEIPVQVSFAGISQPG